MAQTSAIATGALRALTFRISSTPPKQLPGVAPQIAASIWSSRDLISTPSDSKQNSDISAAVHRLKTQLSSLLQDRSIEGRWSAIVLVKATIEAGGVEILSKSNAWVRFLLGILKKPDPPTTRNLAVITLTRIFTLTWDYSNLVREITTPALATFVPTCLANMENKRCTASELQTILESFAVLLPRHPTLFRNSEYRLRAFLASVISSPSSEPDSTVHYTQAHIASALRLWVLLHTCAPKQGAAEKWDETIKQVVRSAHATCDRVFRAVHESWQTTAEIQPSLPSHLLIAGNLGLDENDALGLNPWKGVYAGGERLVTLVQLIESHIATLTPSAVAIPIGLITDLFARLFGAVIIQPGLQTFIKINSQIHKDERDAMFTILPKIHVAAAELAITLLQRLGTQAHSWSQLIFEQTLYVFRAHQTYPEVRSAFYRLFTIIISLGGPTMSRSAVTELDQVLTTCCQDLLPLDEAASLPSSKTTNIAGGTSRAGGSSAKTDTKPSNPTDFSGLEQSARILLSTTLSRLESSSIPPKLRAQIDRTGVLTEDKEILVASVMEPPRKPNGSRVQASLLPVLARQFGQAAETEALLRPRMPPVASMHRGEIDEDFDDDMEDGIAEQNMLHHVEEEESKSGSDILRIAVEPEGDEQSHGKRRATEDVEVSSFNKRFCVSPVAEARLPTNTESLSRAEPPAIVPEVPESAALSASATDIINEATTYPPVHAEIEPFESLPADNPKLEGQDGGGSESDESEFEMPPLTMEPDTDSDDDE